MDLHQLQAEALAAIAAAADEAALDEAVRRHLGKQGPVTALMARIPGLPAEERPAFGQAVNTVKRSLEAAIAGRREVLGGARIEAARAGAGYDPTLPGTPLRRGSLHPLTQVRREVEAIFRSMGYEVVDGPEVELAYYNFEALNIPADHPARDHQDTFYCDDEGRLVLRTHTSPIQIRAMERRRPPMRLVAPGRVFRNEAQDAKHEHTFHQLEGLVIDRGIHVGHLSGTLRGLLRQLFGAELEIRLRPGYFPFVEPGFEVDIRLADREHRAGPLGDWMEYCGCGMVHPAVLAAGGVDAQEFSGFAFGMGLDRLALLRRGIDDVRHFLAGDLRFLRQF
jgi:phenylalanyl-tRNA synthetase alpha chain